MRALEGCVSLPIQAARSSAFGIVAEIAMILKRELDDCWIVLKGLDHMGCVQNMQERDEREKERERGERREIPNTLGMWKDKNIFLLSFA